MSLSLRLARHIAQAGPISIADFMDRCLHDLEDGYYATRPKLGAQGDFITAPHVSQMFGELLGLWAADVWDRLGRRPLARLVELGPGDGVMMTDVLRAARVAPPFLAACEVWLVETSAPLRRLQECALSKTGVAARWVRSLADVPADAPLLILANEFLDCLPIRQRVMTEAGWTERRVGLDEKGLSFELARLDPPVGSPSDAPVGTIAEWSDELVEMGRSIGGLIGRATGAALFVDYGRAKPGFGDTLQALRGQRRESPLDHPGEADLTAHVDFPAFLRAARDGGASAAPIVTQRDFLLGLGIEARAAALAAASPDKRDLIGRQLARLIAKDQMGDLFKAACIHSPGLVPPGFEHRR